MSDSASSSVKSASRVLDLLDLLARWRGERTHAQIAAELQIPKSSLTQILRTLTARGYVTLDPDTRGYRLGPAVDRLAGHGRRVRDLGEAAGPVLQQLTELTGESSALNLQNGDDHEVAATVLSPQRIVAHLRLGERAPLHATSGGQAILAHLPDPARAAYLARARWEAWARNALTGPEAVQAKLRSIRAEGHAVVQEEFTPGIGGLSMPILDRDGQPLASIGVTVPMDRFDAAFRARALPLLTRAVARLRHEAGLTDDAPATLRDMASAP